MANLPVSTLPPGVDSITAVYNGDANYGSSTSNVVQVTVTALLPTSIALTSSANPQLVGQPVTITATISSTGTTATGTIAFYSGTQSLCTAPVNSSGAASFASSALPAGILPITASYGGDSLHLGSSAPVLAQMVTDFTIGSSTPIIAINLGQVATFTLYINPVAGTSFGSGVTLSATGTPSNSQTCLRITEVAEAYVWPKEAVTALRKPEPSDSLM